ncbi:3'-phosphoesterase [Candidatus Babeliales bacterium]|nr:3'-phosphoesterase [Candidatus Babeliales bacterium]
MKRHVTQGLSRYRNRRDFKQSPEPHRTPRQNLKRKNRFVIQKHAARNLHYDFRLQVGNVLKSWAVPKGPSINPADKRLAIPTDDHPLAYATFEGVIPKDNYGAGVVMVWDIGTYKNITKHDGKAISMARGYREGHLEFELYGKKLRGKFALVQTESKYKGKQYWLLVKMRDTHEDRRRKPIVSQQRSVLTDRTMDQIKRDES